MVNLEGEIKAEIEYGGRKIEIWYQPITRAIYRASMQRAARAWENEFPDDDGIDPIEFEYELIKRCVHRWTLTTTDGKPVPCPVGWMALGVEDEEFAEKVLEKIGYKNIVSWITKQNSEAVQEAKNM